MELSINASCTCNSTMSLKHPGVLQSLLYKMLFLGFSRNIQVSSALSSWLDLERCKKIFLASSLSSSIEPRFQHRLWSQNFESNQQWLIYKTSQKMVDFEIDDWEIIRLRPLHTPENLLITYDLWESCLWESTTRRTWRTWADVSLRVSRWLAVCTAYQRSSCETANFCVCIVCGFCLF